MNSQALEAFRAHAREDYPNEACGFLVAVGRKMVYVRSRNTAAYPGKDFETHPEDYLAAQRQGQIIALCHSHPNAPSAASPADRTACERSNMPWYVLSWPGNELERIEPCGYTAPLLGRPFVHGVHDCYALVRDYYAQELKIDLPGFERPEEWWYKDRDGNLCVESGKPSMDLLTENFEATGFTRVQTLQPHDGIMMQLGPGVTVANHTAVYLGDGIMMHHMFGQLSARAPYGGYWHKHNRGFYRHRDLI